MGTCYHQKAGENHTDNTRKERTVPNRKLNFLNEFRHAHVYINSDMLMTTGVPNCYVTSRV